MKHSKSQYNEWQEETHRKYTYRSEMKEGYDALSDGQCPHAGLRASLSSLPGSSAKRRLIASETRVGERPYNGV